MAKKKVVVKMPEEMVVGDTVLRLTGDSIAIIGKVVREHGGGEVELRIARAYLKQLQQFMGRCMAFIEGRDGV